MYILYWALGLLTIELAKFQCKYGRDDGDVKAMTIVRPDCYHPDFKSFPPLEIALKSALFVIPILMYKLHGAPKRAAWRCWYGFITSFGYMQFCFNVFSFVLGNFGIVRDSIARSSGGPRLLVEMLFCGFFTSLLLPIV